MGVTLKGNNQFWIQGSLCIEDYLILKAKIDSTAEDIELHFDSMGGTVLGIDEIAEAIYARRKTVVSYVHGACTSAAYWVACAASRVILCNKTTIVGSIGIKIQHFDNSQMLEKQGVRITELATGINKNVGSENKPLLPTDQKILMDNISKLFNVFVKFVAKCRNIEEKTVVDMQAKEFIGQDAITNNLADGFILGDNTVDLETLQKENEALKAAIETLKKKIEELVKLQEEAEAPVTEAPVEEQKDDVEEKQAMAERHRILALMSLNKGGISDSVVSEAIAKGWDYGKTVDNITLKLSETKKKMQASSKIVPVGTGNTDGLLASMIAKGGK